MAPPTPAAFAGLAPSLTDRYTVMPCDPRGNSRSVRDDLNADQDLDIHGDDAAALLAAVTDRPAYVLGNNEGRAAHLPMTPQEDKLWGRFAEEDTGR